MNDTTKTINPIDPLAPPSAGSVAPTMDQFVNPDAVMSHELALPAGEVPMALPETPPELPAPDAPMLTEKNVSGSKHNTKNITSSLPSTIHHLRSHATGTVLSVIGQVAEVRFEKVKPSQYETLIGKDKEVKLVVYASAGADLFDCFILSGREMLSTG